MPPATGIPHRCRPGMSPGPRPAATDGTGHGRPPVRAVPPGDAPGL